MQPLARAKINVCVCGGNGDACCEGGQILIKEGEYLVCGRSDWNPQYPAFAGDLLGLLDQWNLDEIQDQEFHLFGHCSEEAHQVTYHGREAKGKRLYLGVYKQVPDDPLSDVQLLQHLVPFKCLNGASKDTMAQSWLKWADAGFTCLRVGEPFNQDFDKAKEIFEGDQEDEGSSKTWASLSDMDKRKRAYIERLVREDYKLDVGPIQFVRYDEAVYKYLVGKGAGNGRVAADDNTAGLADLGPV